MFRKSLLDRVSTPELPGTERTQRLLMGLLVADLGLGGIIGSWSWLAMFPMLTGAVGWCPVYALIAKFHGGPPPGSSSETES